MRVVVTLGGNALLKRGEPMTAENQRANVHTAGALGSGSTYGSDGRYASPTDLDAIAGATTGNNLNNFAGQSAFGNVDERPLAERDQWFSADNE